MMEESGVVKVTRCVTILAVSHSSDNEEGGWWVVVVKVGHVSLPLFI